MTRQNGARERVLPVVRPDGAAARAIRILRALRSEEDARENGPYARFTDDAAKLRARLTTFLKTWNPVPVAELPPEQMTDLKQAVDILNDSVWALDMVVVAHKAVYRLVPPSMPGSRGRPKEPLARDVAIAVLGHRANYGRQKIVATLKAEGFPADKDLVGRVLKRVTPDRLERLLGESGEDALVSELNEHYSRNS